jgi:hypothetical protein
MLHPETKNGAGTGGQARRRAARSTASASALRHSPEAYVHEIRLTSVAWLGSL